MYIKIRKSKQGIVLMQQNCTRHKCCTKISSLDATCLNTMIVEKNCITSNIGMLVESLHLNAQKWEFKLFKKEIHSSSLQKKPKCYYLCWEIFSTWTARWVSAKRFDLRKYLKQNIHNVIYTYGWKRTNIMPTKTGKMAIFTTGKNQFNTWRLASIKLLPETVKEGISLIYFLWKTKGCHKSSLLLLPITSQSLSVWHWKMFSFTHASTSDEIWEISKILNQRNFTLFILVANL